MQKAKIYREDTDEIYTFLKNNPFDVFPYNFTKKYRYNDIAVFTDNSCDMRYVLHQNKRLYFKSGWSEEMVQSCYNRLLIEQDIDSPHRYEYQDFTVAMTGGGIVLDIGTAEGNFALSVVDHVSKLYIFEADKTWIPALEKTFAPYKDKVIIINKYVSNQNNDAEICIDDYLGGEEISFIKMDIEGTEIKVLNAMNNILSGQKNIKIAVCTYHRQNDAGEIEELLQAKGFHIEFSKGYMIFKYDKGLKEPYLRKGLIRAKKELIIYLNVPAII